MSHYNLNYHAAAFEVADSYLGNAIDILAHPSSFFSNCVMCAKDTIAAMPQYLSD